ncbi:helix-turn-helix transcriptional regulator [Lysinibacillus capsici]|uniref:helix-turn-helix domain-containing protein n=1 Tax=Lysinibacillus capsici TaxID=2115968 RepID=UPI0028BDEFF1|nr:helix-turn-helix transcriptional regulator [Lysinibacillus capsici]WNN77738.1 helix-turn-helix transcriptional regulator [Lysinibacillus capsici]
MDIDIGGLIKKCRKKAKLSQEAFADLMHTTQSTVSRIEKNIVAVEAKFLARAAAITNSQDVVVATLFSSDAAIQFLQTVPMIIVWGIGGLYGL